MTGNIRRRLFGAAASTIVFVMLSGCATMLDASPPSIMTSYTGEPGASTSPMPPISATAGEAVWVDGQFSSAPTLIMSRDYEGTLQDAAGDEHAMRLPRTTLMRRYADGRLDYYCAERGLAGTRPVPDAGTCVGVRHETATGRLEWVVARLADGAPAVVAAVELTVEGGISFNQGRRLQIDEHTRVTEIVYEGYEDGVLRFSHTVYLAGAADTRTYRFSYPPRTGAAHYRIGEQAIEVLAADPAHIEFRRSTR